MNTTKKLVIAFAIVLFAGIVVPNVIPTFGDSISVQAASIKISSSKKTLYEKKTCTLKIIGTRKKVKWSSSNKSVATVSNKGKVTAKKKGKATITAKVGSKKYTCNITVKTAQISKKAITLYRKNSYTLKILGATQKVKWSNSNKSVASVSSKGKVTAKRAGTTIITAKMGKKKYKCIVTLKNPYIKKAKTNFYPEEEYTLCVYGRKNVKWTSSNPKVATITSKGKVKAKNIGKTIITARCGNEKYTRTVTIKPYLKNEDAKNIGKDLLRYTDHIYANARLGEIDDTTHLRKILNYKEDFEYNYTKNCIKNYWNVPGNKYYIKTVGREKYLFDPSPDEIFEYIDTELEIKQVTDNKIVFNAIGYYYKNIL